MRATRGASRAVVREWIAASARLGARLGDGVPRQTQHGAHRLATLRRRRTLSLVAAAVLATALGPSTGAAPAAGIKPTRIASFGDSYSSGEGLVPQKGLHYD